MIKPSTHSVHSHTVLPSQPHKNNSYFSWENGSEFGNEKPNFSSKKLISLLLIKRGPPHPCLKDYIADRHDDRRSGYFCLTVQNDKKNALWACRNLFHWWISQLQERIQIFPCQCSKVSDTHRSHPGHDFLTFCFELPLGRPAFLFFVFAPLASLPIWFCGTNACWAREWKTSGSTAIKTIH